jgi:aminopeptidase N
LFVAFLWFFSLDTATVYSKGSEIIGIYKTLLGEEGFKRGLKLYFARHDGTAVTCDDFRNAMAGLSLLSFICVSLPVASSSCVFF